MAKSKGKARMYFVDADSKKHEIEYKNKPTITYHDLDDTDKKLLEGLKPVMRIVRRHTAYSIPLRILQPDTPFSYN